MKKKRKDKQQVAEQAQIDAVEAEKAAKAEKRKKRRPLIFLISAATAAVAVILTAVLVLTLVVFNPYVGKYENPTATLKLSNGMELNFILYEDTCPNTTTNFIYLARIGYFNGAVLFDKSGGYTRFGGWRTDNTHRGDSDTSFKEKFNAQVTFKNGTVRSYQDNLFGYRISAENKAAVTPKTFGALSMIAGTALGTATEFQFTSADKESDITDLLCGSKRTYSSFGLAADEKTRQNLRAIQALSTADYAIDSANYANYAGGCDAPVDGNGMITVKSVKVTKLLKSKWKKFSFMDNYVSEIKESSVSFVSGFSWSTSPKRSGQ